MHNGHEITVTDDRSEILTWLSPIEPHLRHDAIRTSRVKGVGDWILRTKEFQGWRNGDGQGESQKATIFCSGNLGVGKTYISSLLIDTICDEPGVAGEDIAVACFYFDSAAQQEQSATNVLGALLKQVAGSFQQIPEEITDVFKRHKKSIGGRKLKLPEIVKMLESLSSTQRMFFCLDAVDECATPDRAKVLLSLKDIIEISPTTRVLLTGRPYVGGEVRKHFPEGIVLSISPRNNDITRYIRTKLAEDTTLSEMDQGLEAEIVKKIPQAVSGIFSLVSLNLDGILQETTIHRRRERLRVMTTGLGLGDAYGTTLDRIKAQDSYKSRLGATSLMWICHSERQLGVKELCQALAVKIGSTDYNTDDTPSIQTVLNCCQGLVKLENEGSTVELVHHTLREYLISHRSLFQSPHATIAETCLIYLSSQQVMALAESHVQSTQHFPFLEYSTLYWGAHMKKELSDRGKTLALKLFSRYKGHASIKLLLEHTFNWYYLYSIVNFYKFTGLHCASIFGLVEVVRDLTKMDGVDINGMDEISATPLLWAAMSGHEAVVKLLLGLNDVVPDSPDTYGQTPISWAAENGHEAVVELLLGRKDVNPDRPDIYGQAPISWAAKNGHEAVVKLLLGRGEVDLNREDSAGKTPISWAAENGYEAVVKLLLGREDVNPNWPDCEEQTPISLAAENGHEAAVKLFLGREDVDPDKQDCYGQTPISRAAKKGHESVVKLLLGWKDANPTRLTSGAYRTLTSC